MSYTAADIERAYIKLRAYVYHDTTDLLLRQQIVEFDTGVSKDHAWLIGEKVAPYKKAGMRGFRLPKLDERFELLAKALNNYHNDPEFIDSLLGRIKVRFFPKKVKRPEYPANYVTNQRILREYVIDRVTPFIDAPIELHILSVLWILERGHRIDAKLSSACHGNRLLLNKDRDGVVHGSGLFKPYVRQYQTWRDESVKEAERLLAQGKDVAFLNLDVRDYFNSIQLPAERLRPMKPPKSAAIRPVYNLCDVLASVHRVYTDELVNAGVIMQRADNKGSALPIGLLSSYILANQYLSTFDDLVRDHVKPDYYGRYVDDILLVIAIPDLGEERKIHRESGDSNPLHSFIDRHLGHALNYGEGQGKDEHFVFVGYDGMVCQSDKTVLYVFDHNESHSVIDRLKQDLEDRSSEFRDFPDDEENDRSFKENAYHLEYDGTEGKVRTLKDYKENRYGLTKYLSNKIFSALRKEANLADDEAQEVVRFFSGQNCLLFHRLWERILTLLLVNDKPEHYVRFYLHCLDVIDKVKVKKHEISSSEDAMRATLVDYLDCAHELSLTLDLGFFDRSAKAARQFEFGVNESRRSHFTVMFNEFEATQPNSFWRFRFRQSNMLRHHFVVQPLLTYTTAAASGTIKDLTRMHVDFAKYALSDTLLERSPRQLKYWECCLASYISAIASGRWPKDRPRNRPGRKAVEFGLSEAYELFRKGNKLHIPEYELDVLAGRLYKSTTKENGALREIHVDAGNRHSGFSIAFANTEVSLDNMTNSLRDTPNVKAARYKRLAQILKKSRVERSSRTRNGRCANVLLLPEFFIPLGLMSSITRHAVRNDTLTITGLEHLVLGKFAYNFIATILPFTSGSIQDAVVVLRLKNHYSHAEGELVKEEHRVVPKVLPACYDLFNWRNLYFAPYYCFELADVEHRALFKSKIDLLVGVEWNRDTPYFSNIVESISRDLHCYVAQVNTSQFGDTRLTQPKETALKNLLQLKGGENDAVLIAEIDTTKIREFQRKAYGVTHQRKEFKPLPPDFEHENVEKRIRNEFVL
jgi:hypothetical protein